MRVFAVVGLLATLAGVGTAWLVFDKAQRAPNEWLRYIERRLYGHTTLENLAAPFIGLARAQLEREVPTGILSALGKGVRQYELQSVSYDDRGFPRETPEQPAAPPVHQAQRIVASAADLVRHLAEARAGDIIEILPGTYRITTGNLGPANPGRPGQPITVRAAKPGRVTLELGLLEGFQVNQPYWVFENLVLRGICAQDTFCEHAFHITGKAQAIVIRNNTLLDFNAHIKVNGINGAYPDAGLVQFNSIGNSRSRHTANPVSPIDIVAASRWVVVDNVVSHFHKTDGSGVSYGIYMKGGGADGRFERNLVICSATNISEHAGNAWQGERVGISFGNGGTDTQYCRDKLCTAEHTGGIVRNNIVAHCSDSGIDINSSVQVSVSHNTLINTSGITLRGSPTSVTVEANIVEGGIRRRAAQEWLQTRDNLFGDTGRLFRHRDALDLGWVRAPDKVPTGMGAINDFCGRPRGQDSFPGALAIDAGCAANANHTENKLQP